MGHFLDPNKEWKIDRKKVGERSKISKNREEKQCGNRWKMSEKRTIEVGHFLDPGNERKKE